MATLILLQGGNPGRRFECDGETTTVGRQSDCAVCLDDPAVSRRHARLLRQGDSFRIEDLGSSNGTYVNGLRIESAQPLTEQDTLQIGPYVLTLHLRPMQETETDPVVRSQVPALSSNASLFESNAGYKLQVVVEIAHHLGRTLEVKPLLDKLLEQLFRLFYQAERGLVILCEGDKYAVRAQRQRHQKHADIASSTLESGDFAFSRSLVRHALEEGAGLLSEDVSDDINVPKTATLMSLNLRSFLCVPLIGLDQRRLGVLQLDCLRPNLAFNHEDLELLTAISLQVAGVLENAALHEERLREERLHQELALAREIQQSFLPRDFRPMEGQYELYARCVPAREMSGDLYDFMPLPDGRLALFVGDVSGKGMPSALFMIAARTLIRHLSVLAQTPAQLLTSLNNALVADNPTSLFVTLVHATYDPRTGEVVIVSGGHPLPLLRRANGQVETVQVRPAMMLGYARFDWPPQETHLVLKPGELIAFYTDGLTEAFTPGRQAMFGEERLRDVLTHEGAKPLADCAEVVYKMLAEFIRQPEQQDDQTLLLLRRT